MNEKLQLAESILREAIAEYRPDAVLGLFSGGHDSLTVTHFAAPFLDAVAHINTGIGIPETRQFVRDTCKRYGWNLDEREAAKNVNAKGELDPQVYEDIVCENGFPGAFGHTFMYSRLKERQVRGLVRDYKRGGKVALISGCRKEESTRRMGTVEPVQVRGNTIWIAPFTHMTGSDLEQYMRDHDLPRNPVKDRLCMSGECLCGAFAKPGELREIEFWYPDTAAEIRRIEKRVTEAGFPWGWEQQPPEWWLKKKAADKAGQQDAFDLERDEVLESEGFQPLCSHCHLKNESASDGLEDSC